MKAMPSPITMMMNNEAAPQAAAAAMPSPVIVVPPEPQDIQSFGWGDFPLAMAPIVVAMPQEQQQHSVAATAPCMLGKKRTLHYVEESTAASRGFSSRCLSFESDEDESESSDSSSAMDISVVSSTSSTTRRRNNNNRGRSVSFSTVQVQEHALTLGDHPWADEYPLTLDWQHSNAVLYQVDEFERDHRRQRRNAAAPLQRLTSAERKVRLAIVNETSLAQLHQQEMERQQARALEAQRLPFLPCPIKDSAFSSCAVPRTVTVPGGLFEVHSVAKRSEVV